MHGPKWSFLLILNCIWTWCGRYENLGQVVPGVSGYPTSMSIPWVDGLSTDPQVMGRHSLVSELRYTNTYGFRDLGLGHGRKVYEYRRLV